MNQTLLSYSEYFLVATYIEWRLSFLVLREAISSRFYKKNILLTNVKNALEQETAPLPWVQWSRTDTEGSWENITIASSLTSKTLHNGIKEILNYVVVWVIFFCHFKDSKQVVIVSMENLFIKSNFFECVRNMLNFDKLDINLNLVSLTIFDYKESGTTVMYITD